MSKKYKKIIGVSMAVALLGSAFAFVGCKDDGYKGDVLTGYVSDAQVSSNGGFVVEKGDYVYFINGAEDYTANNKYGDVLKGSLLRIKKSDMKAGNYNEETVQRVVPSLFVSGNHDSGIYIYGDYVYYATPTTDTTVKGESKNSELDFKRAKLDGSEAPSETFLRLQSNSSKYRFVTEKGVDRNNDGKDDVFCLYEEDSALKSLNVATGEKVVLVKGAGTFFYDQNDLSNPNVYYTMPVTVEPDSENPTSVEYNQIYCVNASARATVNANEASYTVENGRTYSFNKAFMQEKAEEKGYDLNDYKTYPYVNLGTLVLDGIGNNTKACKYTQLNGGTAEDQKKATEPQGYVYTITKFASNGDETGVYFTRKNIVTTPSEASDQKLYYVSESQTKASGWNQITGNQSVDTVAEEYGDSMNASSKALFTVEKDGDNRVHTYFYTKAEGEKTYLYKQKADEDSIDMTEVDSDVTLWTLHGDYLYYYGTGTNGYSLNRINYTGTRNLTPSSGEEYRDDYHEDFGGDEYKAVEFPLVDWYDAWYKPEFVSLDETVEMVMYANAQTYGTGTSAYNYIYATETSKSNKDLLDLQKEYEKYEDLLEHEDYKDESDAQNLIKYFFFGGEVIPEEYAEKYEDLTWDKDAIIAKFTASEGAQAEIRKADSFIQKVSRMTDADDTATKEALKGWLIGLDKEETKDESGLPGYAIGLIVAGSVLLVGAGVAIPLVIVMKKKKAKKLEMEATVNAYKRKKIDTTDDKSIDVYADENAETPVEETAEETVEEVVEEDNQTQE